MRQAPRPGLEPGTNRLTAGCSTIELSGKSAGVSAGFPLRSRLPKTVVDHRRAIRKPFFPNTPPPPAFRGHLSMAEHVVIIGAGLAGLAAAAALAGRGWRITLLESRGR